MLIRTILNKNVNSKTDQCTIILFFDTSYIICFIYILMGNSCAVSSVILTDYFPLY